MDDQLKQVLRRLDNIEKTQNIQYQDRGIMEDILIKIDKVVGVIDNLKTEVGLLTDRLSKLEKNQRADTRDVLQEVQSVKDKTDEVIKGIGGGE